MEGCWYLQGPARRQCGLRAGRRMRALGAPEKSVSQPGHQGLVVTVKTSDFTVSEEAVHKERLSPKE